MSRERGVVPWGYTDGQTWGVKRLFPRLCKRPWKRHYIGHTKSGTGLQPKGRLRLVLLRQGPSTFAQALSLMRCIGNRKYLLSSRLVRTFVVLFSPSTYMTEDKSGKQCFTPHPSDSLLLPDQSSSSIPCCWEVR